MHLFGHAGPISLRTECFRDEVRRIPQPGHTLRPAETASQFPFIHLRPFLQGFSRAGVCHRGLLRIRQKELKGLLNGLGQANLTVRNFPDTVAGLRKRLKLKEGGNVYLFATTLADGRHVLLRCRKAEPQ